MSSEEEKLQEEIKTYIGGLESGSIKFDYSDVDGKTKLNVITISPRHNQNFLFHTEIGYDNTDALKRMLEYVKQYKARESSYTIQWSERDSTELITSYFRARNLPEALDKFLFGRDVNALVIFSVVLNPLS
jgi:hypothetical protein